MPRVSAYFQGNWNAPNLIIYAGRAKFDLTATFAAIEKGFGSRTPCDEKEAWQRRAEKEKLKLACIAYLLCEDDPEEELGQVMHDLAQYWLLPALPVSQEAYTAFHKKDEVNEPL